MVELLVERGKLSLVESGEKEALRGSGGRGGVVEGSCSPRGFRRCMYLPLCTRSAINSNYRLGNE